MTMRSMCAGLAVALVAVALVVGATGLCGCAAEGTRGAAAVSAGGGEAPPGFDASGEQAWDSFIDVDGDRRVFIGGQPSGAALDAFRAAGGTAVVNLKTAEEMAGWPDYAEQVAARGLAYVHVPTAADGMGSASATAFRDATAGLGAGPVLVHCQASGRALYAVALDRVRAGELTATEAIEWARWLRGGAGWPEGEAAIRAVALQRHALP